MKKFYLFITALSLTLTCAANTIYLNTGGNDLWGAANATFFIHAWSSTSSDSQFDMKMNEFATDVYITEIPAEYDMIIFVRMPEGSEVLDWDLKWNQTSDLSMYDGVDCYTIIGWGTGDYSEGQWSVYGSSTGSDMVTLNTYATPNDIGYVYVNGSSVSGQAQFPPYTEVTLSAEISTGGYMFANWSDGSIDNPRTLVLSHDTTIYAVFSDGEYGILINRERLVRGISQGKTQGYVSQFLASVQLEAGETIEVIDVMHGNNSTWLPTVEENGEYANFVNTGNKLKCSVSGCYDFYIKIGYGVSTDYLYIGPAGETGCSSGEYYPVGGDSGGEVTPGGDTQMPLYSTTFEEWGSLNGGSTAETYSATTSSYPMTFTLSGIKSQPTGKLSSISGAENVIGYLQNANTGSATSAYIETSVLPYVSTIRFTAATNVSNGGWRLQMKQDGATDWETLTEEQLGKNNIQTMELPLEMSNVQLRWQPLVNGGYNYLTDLYIYGSTESQGGGQTEEITQYGLLINGNRFVNSVQTDDGGANYSQYLSHPTLNEGDFIEVIDTYNNNGRWMPALEQFGEYANFTNINDTALVCNVAGCYDFYIKLGNPDALYIGPSSGNCSGGTDYYVYDLQPTDTTTQPATIYLDVYTNDTTMGYVNGAGFYPYSTDEVMTIAIEAVPHNGYIFSQWSDGNTDNPRDIVLDSFEKEYHYMAVFVAYQQQYTITYLIDSAFYRTDTLNVGDSIPYVAAPEREGYTFTGWSEHPTYMPAEDITITGNFNVNSYVLTYMVDGEFYYADTIPYGNFIRTIGGPTPMGMTFTGWQNVPETMPASDITITGSLEANHYMLYYVLEGNIYDSASVAYGTAIEPIAGPTREGYTFSGWNILPDTMPANEITVYGWFDINYYKVYYIVEQNVIDSMSVAFGDSVPEVTAPEREGYTFTGWSEHPTYMPAEDITIRGAFVVNRYAITYMVDGQFYATDTLEYGANIKPIAEPTREGQTFSGWQNLPQTMPAADVTVTGAFDINYYKVYYIVEQNVID
ncbi:MAG: InlB B-repeat-containing protein, partial [Paludibacteraceae bacterium]|nr:InlB B-repeat-containing protein [Paludibacteraceae bacterium]